MVFTQHIKILWSVVKIVQTDVAVTNHFFLMAHNLNSQDLVHLCVMLWSHSLWDLDKISNSGYFLRKF